MLGAIIVGAGLLAGAAPALAGSAVTPTLVQLTSPRQTGEVTLYNGGSSPMLVEASVVAWSQDNGRDQFAPTSDFMIAPAIVEIQPGSGQIFRVRARAAAQGNERTYRLRLEDITPKQTGTGIGMRVRHDLPLILPAVGGKPDLHSSPCPGREADCVRITNQGASLVKITSLTITGKAGEKAINGVSTILAGSWAEWSLDGAAVGQPLQVRAQTGHGTIVAPFERP